MPVELGDAEQPLLGLPSGQGESLSFSLASSSHKKVDSMIKSCLVSSRSLSMSFLNPAHTLRFYIIPVSPVSYL